MWNLRSEKTEVSTPATENEQKIAFENEKASFAEKNEAFENEKNIFQKNKNDLKTQETAFQKGKCGSPSPMR